MQHTSPFRLLPEVYAYSQRLPDGISPLMQFDGVEGPTFIVPLEVARGCCIPFTFPCRCFVLNQKTTLTAVGITSSIATALAKVNIPCNVVAAFHYDYFFVPKDKADHALTVVNALSPDLLKGC